MTFKNILPYGLMVFVGIFVQVANQFSWHPRKEIWDNPQYFIFYLPTIYLVAVLVGFLFPETKRTLLLGMLPFIVQLVMMLLMNTEASLLPLGIVLLFILSLPAMVAIWLGKKIRGFYDAPLN